MDQSEPALPIFTSSFLASSCIQSLTPSFHYISHFLTSQEANALLGRIPSYRWISLSHRRLQVHPSQLSSSNTLLDAPLPAWLTTDPAPILWRFQELGVFKNTKHGQPNHCLVNEYKPGEGIMPHEDGSAYAEVVATVSLGDCTVLNIYSKRHSEPDVDGEGERNDANVPIAQILQEPGSLLITTGDAYADLLHGISPVEEDVNLGPETVANWSMLDGATRKTIMDQGGRNKRATRTSLTFRDVLKVKKIGIGVVGRKQ